MESSEVRGAIRGIYDRFKILPNLRLHMFRTASVAEIVCDNWRGPPINRDDIIAACLLHDIGNIVKFDLKEKDVTLLGKEAKRLDYWRIVKRYTMRKYGRIDHEATHNMMVELRVNKKAKFLVDHMVDVLGKGAGRNYPLMLCGYSDDRVSPGGVMSLADRFADFAKRCRKSSSAENRARGVFVASRLGRALGVEMQLFANARIRPEQINDRSIRPYLDRYTK
jgi:hypothetical protein